MKSEKSKTERILEQKPAHVIDASVLFGIFDTKNENNKKFCETYLGAMGHKYRGFTTIPLLGETFLAITKQNDQEFRNKAYAYIAQLLKQDLLDIIPIKRGRDSHVDAICKIHQYIKEDDATHLSNAIHGKHTRFITLDNDLVAENKKITRQKLREECGISIYHPKEMIEKLKI